MSHLRITGKSTLSGKVNISGNKNAALPCLAASLLLEAGQTMKLLNVPNIRDTRVFIEILKDFGLEINWLNFLAMHYDSDKQGHLSIKAYSTPLPENTEIKISPKRARELRASILLVGPLLRLRERVLLPQPGGCNIGPRPIDTHIEAFRELGVKIDQANDGFTRLEKKYTKEDADTKELWLKETSVTATENILLFTAGNRRNALTIKNAACEPHIATLCQLLERMGAKIDGIGSNLLIVNEGLLANYNKTPQIEIEIEPDYIEALTFAVAAAVTQSAIIIKNVLPDHLELIAKYLEQMDVKNTFKQKGDGKFDWIIRSKHNPYKISPTLKEIKAEPWYGLPTDALPLFLVLATQCEGELEFVDYMYNGRLINLANSLNNMGADIKLLGNRGLLVKGPTPLRSRTMLSPDIRNGVGLVLAGLCAEGKTIIQNFEIVERGYENLPQKLTTLGVEVEII